MSFSYSSSFTSETRSRWNSGFYCFSGKLQNVGGGCTFNNGKNLLRKYLAIRGTPSIINKQQSTAAEFVLTDLTYASRKRNSPIYFDAQRLQKKLFYTIATVRSNVVYSRIHIACKCSPLNSVWPKPRLKRGWCRQELRIFGTCTRGVMTLDGARGKKQDGLPHVRNWGLSEVNVLYWRKYLWHCWNYLAPRSHSAPGDCTHFAPLDTPLHVPLSLSVRCAAGLAELSFRQQLTDFPPVSLTSVQEMRFRWWIIALKATSNWKAAFTPILGSFSLQKSWNYRRFSALFKTANRSSGMEWFI